jgi:transposase
LPVLERPEDIAALKAQLAAMDAELAAERLARAEVLAQLAEALAFKELAAHQALEIAKLRQQLYGRSAERARQLTDQLELALDDAVADATAAEIIADAAAAEAGVVPVRSFERKKPARAPLPEHLPRERVVEPAPCACEHCGSHRLVKVGEDVTETLEVIPRQWKVVQHVRERFACRACEGFSQVPAPFHAIARGRAGPSLLAMVLYEKYGQHVPLNRQAERYAREGVPFAVSTLADQVGACAVALQPMADLIEAHVLGAGRIHADDTPVPLLDKGKTTTARLWTYVRDDRPFAGTDPPAVLFKFSDSRSGDHPKAHLAKRGGGILQADAFAGYNHLFDPARSPAPFTEAACWAHARRKFFELASLPVKGKAGPAVQAASPMARTAVAKIDAIFAIEREINGATANERLATRTSQSTPLVADLFDWMTAERAKLSRHSPVAAAMDYLLKRQAAFSVFLTDGRACLSNNAAERSLRPAALGRKAWLFAGSQAGGERAALIYTLIGTAKLNNIDPQAWLAHLLAHMPAWPASRLHELAPWNWKPAP